ncbi:MAG: hypothetical protein KDA28_06975, partial [Phycisphaerales bacterium]|nr:hypothetical protein [Phycisphaerales bacterium]
ASAIELLTQAAGGVEEADEIGALIDQLQAVRNTPEAPELEARIIERIKASGGAAARQIVEAEAARWETFTRSWGDAERYTGLLALYEAAPTLFRLERYIDALQDMTQGARVFIVSDDVNLRVDLNAETKDATGEIFQPEEDF